MMQFSPKNILVLLTLSLLFQGCGAPASDSSGSSSSSGSIDFIGGPSETTQSISVTKDAITWTLDRNYEVGQYVNGDYFVVDPGSGVTITSVSPGQSGSGSNFRNGSVVNPSGSNQGYDGRVADYDGSQSVSFPITLSAGDSLVSTVSQIGAGTDVYGYGFPDGKAHLSDASVLTVVSNTPDADSFRPPFVGTTKPTYNATSLEIDLLPEYSLSSRPSLSYLADAADWFKRPWLDHKSGWQGRPMHPVRNMANYGREIGHSTSIAAALLMLDYTNEQKADLLINFVQTGIDLYWMSKTGTQWVDGGGHSNGRKWPIVFAGIMLNDIGMQAVNATFGEDNQTYRGVTPSANIGQSNVAYFGKPGDDRYYQNGCSGDGGKDVRPSTLDDDACETYRNCCTSITWVGTSLSVLMMNKKAIWDHDPYFDYVDRWMGFGTDPQVVSSNKATSASFIRDMWDQYRSSL